MIDCQVLPWYLTMKCFKVIHANDTNCEYPASPPCHHTVILTSRQVQLQSISQRPTKQVAVHKPRYFLNLLGLCIQLLFFRVDVAWQHVKETFSQSQKSGAPAGFSYGPGAPHTADAFSCISCSYFI